MICYWFWLCLYVQTHVAFCLGSRSPRMFSLWSHWAANLVSLILHLRQVRSNIQKPSYWSQSSIGVGLGKLHGRYEFMEELQVKRTATVNVAILWCYRIVLDKPTHGKNLLNYSVYFPDKALFLPKTLSFLFSNPGLFWCPLLPNGNYLQTATVCPGKEKYFCGQDTRLGSRDLIFIL